MSKTSDTLNDVIVKLKSEGTQAKLDEHLYAIPQRADELLVEQVFAYHASDRKRIIFNPANCICIKLNAVKFFPMLARAYLNLQDTVTPVIDLIEFNKIYPFMLFINGLFIPWENIKLIISMNRLYFFIEFMDHEMDMCRMVRTVYNMNLIILPSHIIYSMGVNADDQYTNLFSFDYLGRYTDYPDQWYHAIYYPTDRLTIEKHYNMPNNHTFAIRQDAKYKYFDENFFVWTDGGYLCPEAEVKSLGGLARISYPEGISGVTCISCINSKQTEVVDNINKPVYDVISTDIAQVLSQSSIIEYAQNLAIPFDLSMDRSLDYATNRKNAIEYILNYRTDLFYELYDLDLNFFTLAVDYNWIMSHRDDDGYLSIPRRGSKLGNDYFIILFINGELFKYYKHHFYNANKFLCPVASIAEGDDIELLFFKGADVFGFDTVINSDDGYLPLHNKYYNDSTLIFCKETADTYFTFPDTGNQHFPVPYSYQTDANGNKKIVFDDNFYYGKTVSIAPDRTFKYFGFYVDEEESSYYKINLGTTFFYCYDYDRYTVFFNGRRLTNDQYRLTVPCRSTTPFFEFEIYLAVPLAYGDRLDIFYLPDTIRDLEVTPTLLTDGTITIDKSGLEYLLGSNLYTIWVNGKKISVSQMKDIDSLTIQLTEDIKSLKHVKITKMGDKNEELESIYQSIDTKPLWDRILEQYGNRNTLLGLSAVSIDDAETDTYAGAIPIVSVMWELIREHYIANAVVDVTGAFIYDYLDQDNTAFDGTDKAGNSIIDAANAERTDNIDQINRYYP